MTTRTRFQYRGISGSHFRQNQRRRRRSTHPSQPDSAGPHRRLDRLRLGPTTRRLSTLQILLAHQTASRYRLR